MSGPSGNSSTLIMSSFRRPPGFVTSIFASLVVVGVVQKQFSDAAALQLSEHDFSVTADPGFPEWLSVFGRLELQIDKLQLLNVGLYATPYRYVRPTTANSASGMASLHLYDNVRLVRLVFELAALKLGYQGSFEIFAHQVGVWISRRADCFLAQDVA